MYASCLGEPYFRKALLVSSEDEKLCFFTYQKLLWASFDEVCSCLWMQTVASNALIAAQGDVAMAVDILSSQE